MFWIGLAAGFVLGVIVGVLVLNRAFERAVGSMFGW